MPANTSAEIGIRDLRATLSDVLNDTAVRGRITYVTSNGRRVAAIVPVPDAEFVQKAADDRHALDSLKTAIAGLPDAEKNPFLVRWYEQMTGEKI
jgi:prevent-host-death family protein